MGDMGAQDEHHTDGGAVGPQVQGVLAGRAGLPGHEVGSGHPAHNEMVKGTVHHIGLPLEHNASNPAFVACNGRMPTALI